MQFDGHLLFIPIVTLAGEKKIIHLYFLRKPQPSETRREDTKAYLLIMALMESRSSAHNINRPQTSTAFYSAEPDATPDQKRAATLICLSATSSAAIWHVQFQQARPTSLEKQGTRP